MVATVDGSEPAVSITASALQLSHPQSDVLWVGREVFMLDHHEGMLESLTFRPFASTDGRSFEMHGLSVYRSNDGDAVWACGGRWFRLKHLDWEESLAVIPLIHYRAATDAPMEDPPCPLPATNVESPVS